MSWNNVIPASLLSRPCLSFRILKSLIKIGVEVPDFDEAQEVIEAEIDSEEITLQPKTT